MGCLGVHFAITEDEVRELRDIDDEQERLEFFKEVIEPRYWEEEKFLAESGKAWDAIHRALSDGFLKWDGGEPPLNQAILGGQSLYFEDNYILSLKTPEEVRGVAAALQKMTRDEFRRRYDAIDEDEYDGDLSEDDFEHTWGGLETVRELFVLAAEQGRYVLFTADQ